MNVLNPRKISSVWNVFRKSRLHTENVGSYESQSSEVCGHHQSRRRTGVWRRAAQRFPAEVESSGLRRKVVRGEPLSDQIVGKRHREKFHTLYRILNFFNMAVETGNWREHLYLLIPFKSFKRILFKKRKVSWRVALALCTVFRICNDSFGFLPRFLHFPVIYKIYEGYILSGNNVWEIIFQEETTKQNVN